MAVNPGRETRGDGASLMQHRWSMFEISDPQRACLLACPAAADRLLAGAELAACGTFPAEVAIEGRARQATTELLVQNTIDDDVAAPRLFLLQFDRPVQQRLLLAARTAPVAAPAAECSLDSLVPQPLPPAAECAHGDPLPPAIGQQTLLLGQAAEVRFALRFRDFSQKQWTE